MAKGKIIRLLGGFYTIKTEDGKIVESRAKGNFRHKDIAPLVGDYVNFKEGEGDTLGYIEKVYPRTSVMLRPPVANVDQVMVIIPVEQPKYNLDLITKLLVHYERQKIPIIIVISKIDLDCHEGEFLKQQFQRIGYPTYSLVLTDKEQVETLRPLLQDKTTVLAGVSAAGKSTLTTHFIDEEVKVGGLSAKTQRGKHTTRHNELFDNGEGIYILDTPGFSSIDLREIESDSLKNYFPEFLKLEGTCKFMNCSHSKEPGCAVKQEVEQGIIWDERYQSYIKMYEEQKDKEKHQW
ncbi:MAG: ribosome small subunit-dependent GTPase A [Tissierellia bacterium]|nr:ribosome small subunit-dependent GTPase A [Tissierellia bacterium]